MKLRSSAFLFVSILSHTACAAQSTYVYSQGPTGDWSSKNSETNDDLASANVHCDGQNTEVSIIWYSESGDWTAYDTYRPIGKMYFERRIKFAQFPVQVHIVKSSPEAEPMINFQSQDGEAGEYKDLIDLPPVVTFNHAKEFPFALPNCAVRAFNER